MLTINTDHHNTAEARFRVASAFMEQQAAQYLDEQQLVTRCAAEVMARFDVSQRTATNDAMHALAAHQARRVPAYVDVQHSTSAVVYITNPRTGRLVAFTASELLTLADEHRATTQDGDLATARCGRRADF